jgi:hypothetical protein
MCFQSSDFPATAEAERVFALRGVRGGAGYDDSDDENDIGGYSEGRWQRSAKWSNETVARSGRGAGGRDGWFFRKGTRWCDCAAGGATFSLPERNDLFTLWRLFWNQIVTAFSSLKVGVKLDR